MIIWFCFILSVLLLSNFSSNKRFSENVRFVTKVLLIIVVVWFSAFRDGLGEDYFNYVKRLSYGLEFSILQEPLFSLISIFIKETSFSYVFFFLIMSIVTNILIIKTYYRYDYFFWIMYVFFLCTIFYFNTFNLVRQMFAISVIMFGTKYILERKFLNYLLCVFVAMSMHVSALFMLPFYFILNKRVKSIFLLLVLALSIVIGQILRLDITSYFSTVPFYDIYLNSDETQVGFSFLTLFFNLVLVNILFYRSKLIDSPEYNIAFNMFFLGVIMYNFIPSFYFIFRFALYFLIFAPVMVALLNKLSYHLLIKFAIFLIFGCLFFLFIYNNQENAKIVPDKILSVSNLFD